MKSTLLAVASMVAMTTPFAQSSSVSATMKTEIAPMVKPEDVRAVSPALDRYNQARLLGEVWKRPGLSARDRSIVTVAALIARNQTAELAFYLNMALDSGVKPQEISELITHLAFYSGWGNAMAAVPIAKQVFDQRGVKAADLPAAAVELLPLNLQAEAQRAARVEQDVGSSSTPAPRCSMRCASTSSSPAPRRAATMANAAPAPCWWTASASTPASPWP
jgi:4-carboxymuconolactone decarboxylase